MASVSVLLVSMSGLVLVFDESIMHTSAPKISGTPSGIIGGSPWNDPRMDDGFN